MWNVLSAEVIIYYLLSGRLGYYSCNDGRRAKKRKQYFTATKSGKNVSLILGCSQSQWQMSALIY